jgi:chromosome partitioning protein
MASRVIALANWKGGSGKTSTAVNLSANLAVLGRKTLLIDLDPQSHSTISLGILPFNLQNTIYELLLNNNNSPDECIRNTELEKLFIIPATKRLVNAETDLINYEFKETILKSVITGFESNYEFIIFDCPPSLGILTLNALVAAAEILIPLQTHFLALEGLAQMMEAISRINKDYNHNLRLVGIVPTLTNLKARLTREILSEVKKYFGEEMILNPIRNDIKIAEAPGYKKPLCLYAPKSRGNEDYNVLARQILEMSL